MIKTRKLLALVLSILLVLGMLPVTAISAPPDMPAETHWAYAALQAAVDNGLLMGDKNGNLNPKGSLTRAEMATVINRAFAAVAEADISGYDDVPQKAWYSKEIAKAVAMGTFTGDGNGKMRPNDTILRQEVFAVMARAFKLTGDDLSALDAFSDAGSVSNWAKTPLANMAKAGYINGSGGMLNPKGLITRQEFAQVMYNMIKTYAVSETASVQDGNVLVRVGNVMLKNLIISGDLIVADGIADGTLTLENVTVSGRIVIRSGASVLLDGASVVTGDILVAADSTEITVGRYASAVSVIVAADNAVISGFSGTAKVLDDAIGTSINDKPVDAGIINEFVYADQLEVAVYAVNNATYTVSPSYLYINQAAVERKVRDIAIAAIDNSDITVIVKSLSFSIPVSGTANDPDGKSGELKFMIFLSDGGSPAKSDEKILVIPAVPYMVKPNVTVVPRVIRVDYLGSTMMTAEASDIINPTYQWYRTDDAELPGSAIAGETAATLLLTELTQSAFYYCMCGTVKSNVVTVTVGENPLNALITAVNAVTYPAVNQADCADEAAAVAIVKSKAETAVNNPDVTVTVNVSSYTAPVAGTVTDPNGTNGALVFIIRLNIVSNIQHADQRTLTITATPYTAQPTVTVTPESIGVDFMGSTTLTAAASDIINPTYQWYRTDDAALPGSAIAGATAATLLISELTQSAFYYCMCGTVKSNVTEVTVGSAPLQVNETGYNDLADALAAAGTDNTVEIVGDYIIPADATISVGQNQSIVVNYGASLEISEGLTLRLQGDLYIPGKLINRGNLVMDCYAYIDEQPDSEQLMGSIINHGSITLNDGYILDCCGSLINNGSFTNNGIINSYASVNDGYPRFGGITGNPISGVVNRFAAVNNQTEFDSALGDPAVTDIFFAGRDTQYTLSGTHTYMPKQIQSDYDSGNVLKLSDFNYTGTDMLEIVNLGVSFEGNTGIGCNMILTNCRADNLGIMSINNGGVLHISTDAELRNQGNINVYGELLLQAMEEDHGCSFTSDMGCKVYNHGVITVINAGFSLQDWDMDLISDGNSKLNFKLDSNVTDFARTIVRMSDNILNTLKIPTNADFELYRQTYSDWSDFYNDPTYSNDDDIDGEYAMALLLKNGIIVPESSTELNQYSTITRLHMAQLLVALAQKLGINELEIPPENATLTPSDTDDPAAILMARTNVMPLTDGAFNTEGIINSAYFDGLCELEDLIRGYFLVLKQEISATVSSLDELRDALDDEHIRIINIDSDMEFDGENGEPFVMKAIERTPRTIKVLPGVSVGIPEGSTLVIERNVELILDADGDNYSKLYFDGKLERMGVLNQYYPTQVICGPNYEEVLYPGLAEIAEVLINPITDRLSAPTQAELDYYASIRDWPSWDSNSMYLAYLIKHAGIEPVIDGDETYWDAYAIPTYGELLTILEKLYQALSGNPNATLPASVSIDGAQPDWYANNDMCWSLYDLFSDVIPRRDDTATTALSVTGILTEYANIRYTQHVTVTCESTVGNSYGGEISFNNCEFAGGLTVIVSRDGYYHVNLNNNCIGNISVVPYPGQNLLSEDKVSLCNTNGCSVNATANVNIISYNDNSFNLNGVSFELVEANGAGYSVVELKYICNGIHDDDFWNGDQDHCNCVQADNTPATAIPIIEVVDYLGGHYIVSGVLPCDIKLFVSSDISALSANGHEIRLNPINGVKSYNIGANDVSIYECDNSECIVTGTGSVHIYNENANVRLGDTVLGPAHIFGGNDNYGIFFGSGDADLSFKVEQGQWEGENIPITDWTTLSHTTDTQFAVSDNKLHLFKDGTQPWITDPYQVRLSIMSDGYPTVIYERVEHKPETIMDISDVFVEDDLLCVTGNLEIYSMENEDSLITTVFLKNSSDEWVDCGNVSAHDFQNGNCRLTLPAPGIYSAVIVILTYDDDLFNQMGSGEKSKYVIVP